MYPGTQEDPLSPKMPFIQALDVPPRVQSGKSQTFQGKKKRCIFVHVKALEAHILGTSVEWK